MAKCPICNARKGKRSCLLFDEFVCSLCCGNVRKEETCSGCTFFQKPKKNYNNAPAYSVSEMDGNDELESYGNAVEGALCSYDIENGRRMKDSEAIRIIELLIDKYYFNDSQETTDSQMVKDGAHYLDDVIQTDLRDVDSEVIVKLLGVIRFVARRRTRIGREYMHVIHQFVGQRVGPGIRVLSQ